MILACDVYINERVCVRYLLSLSCQDRGEGCDWECEDEPKEHEKPERHDCRFCRGRESARAH